jgi:hypothetical protein
VEDDGNLDLFAIDLKFETQSDSVGVLSAEPPKLIGSFPTSTASNFQYSAKISTLVFSDSVYADGNLSSTKEQDEAWENRGNNAMVFDVYFLVIFVLLVLRASRKPTRDIGTLGRFSLGTR